VGAGTYFVVYSRAFSRWFRSLHLRFFDLAAPTQISRTINSNRLFFILFFYNATPNSKLGFTFQQKLMAG